MKGRGHPDSPLHPRTPEARSVPCTRTAHAPRTHDSRTHTTRPTPFGPHLPGPGSHRRLPSGSDARVLSLLYLVNPEPVSRTCVRPGLPSWALHDQNPPLSPPVFFLEELYRLSDETTRTWLGEERDQGRRISSSSTQSGPLESRESRLGAHCPRNLLFTESQLRRPSHPGREGGSGWGWRWPSRSSWFVLQ